MARKKRPASFEPVTTTVAEMVQQFGAPTALTCPDCGGALWQIDEGDIVRYRCHVGHAFTDESLDVEQRGAVDEALWSAVRVLEEHADLRLRMAQRASLAGLNAASRGFSESAAVAHEQAQAIREILLAEQHLPRGLAAPESRPARGSLRRAATGGSRRRSSR